MNIQNLSSIPNLYEYYNIDIENFRDMAGEMAAENKECSMNATLPDPLACDEGYNCWGYVDENNLGKCKFTETYWADKAYQTFTNNSQASYDSVMSVPLDQRKQKYESMLEQLKIEKPQHRRSNNNDENFIDIKDMLNQDMYDNLEKNYHGKLSHLNTQEKEITNQNMLLSSKNKEHSKQFKKLRNIEDKVQTVNRNIMYDMKDAKYSNVILGYARKLFLFLTLISLILLFLKLKN